MKVFRILFVLVVFISCFTGLGCISNAVFEGSSMEPTLKNGDKILVNSNFGELNRNDIILFKYPEDERRIYVKRIIALPNESIEIREGRVFINAEELEEPFIEQTYNLVKKDMEKIRVPDNHYFVMGDSRDYSSDSRYWGTVRKELILGKYWMTYSEAKD